MPFVYSVDSGALYTSHATPGTEDGTLALRQATRGVDLTAAYGHGRGAGLTSISGITISCKRWTTAGTGGTAVTPSPRRIGTTASTTAADKQTALTPGTISGAYQFSFGFGAAGPGGWMARDSDSAVHLEGGGADELCLYSQSGTASLNFKLSAEIAE